MFRFTIRGMLFLIAVVAASLSLVLALVPGPVWVGTFRLTVHVESSMEQPTSFACEVHAERRYAEHAVETRMIPETTWRGASVDPFDGRPLGILVPVSGEDSFFGTELKRSQYKFLAVIAKMPNGREVGKVIEIPDCRKTQEVYVSIP